MLDLSKFVELADEVDDSDTARSPMLAELDKAMETIAELIFSKKISHKKITSLLQQSGLSDLKLTQFTTWWNSARIKPRREALEAQYKARNTKPATTASAPELRDAASIKKIASAERTLVPTPEIKFKAIDPVDIAKAKADIMTPWSSFLTIAKNAGISTTVISETLQSMDVLEKKGASYTFTRLIPNAIPDVEIGDPFDPKTIKVYPNTLLKVITNYLED